MYWFWHSFKDKPAHTFAIRRTVLRCAVCNDKNKPIKFRISRRTQAIGLREWCEIGLLLGVCVLFPIGLARSERKRIFHCIQFIGRFIGKMTPQKPNAIDYADMNSAIGLQILFVFFSVSISFVFVFTTQRNATQRNSFQFSTAIATAFRDFKPLYFSMHEMRQPHISRGKSKAQQNRLPFEARLYQYHISMFIRDENKVCNGC